jgi:hypothetical protein
MMPAEVLEFGSGGAPNGGEHLKKRFRQMIHEEVDKWIDKLAFVFEESKRPTLTELSDLFTATRGEFLSGCLQHLVNHKYGDLLQEENAPCPQCGKMHKKRRDVSKKTDTMQGAGSITRTWFYCGDCGVGYSPADSALEISQRVKQFDVQKKCVKLAAQVPFECASEIFEDLTGQQASDHFIHEIFEKVGEHARLEEVVPSSEIIGERIKKAATGKWRPILVVTSDGAHMPTRPKAGRKEKRGRGQYKEAKGFRIYLAGKQRIVHIAGWHQVQDEEQFGRDLALAASRIPQEKVRIALLGDGADWLWKHMTKCFPTGRQILDFYHCSEHLHEAAKAQYGEKSREGLEWVEASLCRLFFGEIPRVISSLKSMPPKDAHAEELIGKLQGYLQKHAHQIDYRSCRLGGYPIGSGAIESANKFICHTRMKRSGAWWVKHTGNAMLRIRCAVYNGTYDRVFDHYKKAQLFRNPTLKR